jgi:hypothetical protein
MWGVKPTYEAGQGGSKPAHPHKHTLDYRLDGGTPPKTSTFARLPYCALAQAPGSAASFHPFLIGRTANMALAYPRSSRRPSHAEPCRAA